MGTIKSSESLSLAEYLRSQRTTTQAEVDEIAAEHDAADVSADVRWSALAH